MILLRFLTLYFMYFLKLYLHNYPHHVATWRKVGDWDKDRDSYVLAFVEWAALKADNGVSPSFSKWFRSLLSRTNVKVAYTTYNDVFISSWKPELTAAFLLQILEKDFQKLVSCWLKNFSNFQFQTSE